MRSSGFPTTALACVMASMAAAALAQPKADLGKREYETKCAVCHGLDGKGLGPYAEQLKRKLPDLTLLARNNGGNFPANRTYDTIEGAGKGHGTRDIRSGASTTPSRPLKSCPNCRTTRLCTYARASRRCWST